MQVLEVSQSILPQKSTNTKRLQTVGPRLALVPAYNSVHTIAEVIILARLHVDRVIVYDDGSTDNTTLVAEACGAVVYNSVKNRGKGYALKQLFEYARTMDPSVIVTLDSDMQHDPAQIPELIKPIEERGADVVVGARRNQSRFRSFGNSILDFMSGGSETQSGFRAYSQKAFNEIKVKELGYGVDSQILMDLPEELRIESVPVNLRYDHYSHSRNPLTHFLQVFSYLTARRIRGALGKIRLG